MTTPKPKATVGVVMVSWLAASAAVLVGFVSGTAVCHMADPVPAERLPSWMWRFHLGLATASSIFFFAAFLSHGLTVRLLASWVLLVTLVGVAVLDVERLQVPNQIVVPGALLALLLAPGLTGSPWWTHLAMGVLGGAILLVLAVGPGNSVGRPEVKLGIFFGLVLGELIALTLALALVARLMVQLVLMTADRCELGWRVPLAPYLTGAAAIAVLVL